MCGSMVDIHFAIAENMRGKKTKTTAAKYTRAGRAAEHFIGPVS